MEHNSKEKVDDKLVEKTNKEFDEKAKIMISNNAEVKNYLK